MLCFLPQPKKDNKQFKIKKQTEQPENQTECKSNNQGVKEPFIQAGRRGRDWQPLGGEDRQQGGRPRGRGRGWRTQVIQHLPGYKPGRTTRERDRLRDPGFQHRKLKTQKPLGVRTCRSCTGGRNSQSHRRVH